MTKCASARDTDGRGSARTCTDELGRALMNTNSSNTSRDHKKINTMRSKQPVRALAANRAPRRRAARMCSLRDERVRPNATSHTGFGLWFLAASSKCEDRITLVQFGPFKGL
eukprot:143613-Prymnesium_polylepis.2